MELHHLRTFCAVAEEQNVTRAAKRLYMTPPAVSAHIKALEEELNVTLFTRMPQGMQLTDKGALLMTKAYQILKAAQDLVNHATQMQDYLMGRVTIGTSASAGLLRTAPLIRRVRSEFPGVELAFVASVSGHILNNLISHNLDIGIIFGTARDDTVWTIPLTSVDLVVAVPQQWQSRIEGAQWADIARLPWIYSDGYCPFTEIIDMRFHAQEVTPQQVVQVDDDITKRELVSAGVGLALLERGEAQQQEGIVIWEHEPIPCVLSIAIAKSRKDDPLITAVLSQILEVWHGGTTREDSSPVARETL
jgi:DNA-binding transcriptional LysR family regulator